MQRWVVGALIAALGVGFGMGRASVPGTAGAATSGAAVPARFVGFWETHGGGLSIGTDGVGTDHLRAYVNCTTNRLTACDKFAHNEIYPGQFDTFRITKVQGNTATAGITGSAYSWRVGVKVMVTLGAGDVLTVHMPDGPFRYCGPHAAAGACGA
jgi:hypothetical protein